MLKAIFSRSWLLAVLISAPTGCSAEEEDEGAVLSAPAEEANPQLKRLEQVRTENLRLQQELARTEAELALPLPKTDGEAKKPTDINKVLIVTIAKDRSLLVNGTAVSASEFDLVLKAAYAGRGTELELQIQADASLEHSALVEVMDHARQVGITRISLTTALPK